MTRNYWAGRDARRMEESLMPILERITTWARGLLERSYEEPVLPPFPESRDCGAEPLDAVLADSPRVDLDAYAARARETMRAGSDLRPMAEIHQEALSEAARRGAAERVCQWHDCLNASALDAGLTVLDPVTGDFYGRRERREAQAGTDGARQAACGELDAGFEAGR
jgi:hypothetical protein